MASKKNQESLEFMEMKFQSLKTSYFQAAQESSRNAIMYPRVERGKQVLMPEYNAFSDPHLQNYYRKKFAGPPAIEPCKKSTLRVRFPPVFLKKVLKRDSLCSVYFLKIYWNIARVFTQCLLYFVCIQS